MDGSLNNILSFIIRYIDENNNDYTHSGNAAVEASPLRITLMYISRSFRALGLCD